MSSLRQSTALKGFCIGNCMKARQEVNRLISALTRGSGCEIHRTKRAFDLQQRLLSGIPATTIMT